MWIFFYIFFFFFWGGGAGVITTSVLFCFIFFFLGGGGGGSFLYILGIFKVKYRMRIFFGAAKFQIFLGMPDIPVFFFFGGGGRGGVGVNSKCWVQAYV